MSVAGLPLCGIPYDWLWQHISRLWLFCNSNLLVNLLQSSLIFLWIRYRFGFCNPLEHRTSSWKPVPEDNLKRQQIIIDVSSIGLKKRIIIGSLWRVLISNDPSFNRGIHNRCIKHHATRSITLVWNAAKRPKPPTTPIQPPTMMPYPSFIAPFKIILAHHCQRPAFIGKPIWHRSIIKNTITISKGKFPSACFILIRWPVNVNILSFSHPIPPPSIFHILAQASFLL